MPQQIYISHIQKFSTHDGYGIRTNVFFKSCPMKCKWCANPETIEPFPQLMFYSHKCINCGKCLPVCAYDSIVVKNGRMSQNFDHCKHCGKCVETCLNDAREINGRLMTPEEVFEEVNQDKVFYQSSGGDVTF